MKSAPVYQLAEQMGPVSSGEAAPVVAVPLRHLCRVTYRTGIVRRRFKNRGSTIADLGAAEKTSNKASNLRSSSPLPNIDMADSPRRREHGSGLFPSSRPRGRSQSKSPPTVRKSRSPLRSRDRVNAANPGNTLYITGLSSRVTEKDLEMHFSKEGKVVECYLIVEPRTRASRGFAFVTMNNVEDAERCIKYLNHSVMEGRYITVEKSRRKRARTPTPGNYLGLKKNPDTIRYDHGRHRGGYRHDDYGYRASPRHSPYRVIRDYSPRRSPYGASRSRRERSRSYSPARM